MRVTLIAVQSLDGFITKHNEQGTAFASPADQAHFATTLQHFDCSIMGAKTYRVARGQIRARLGPQRRRIVLTRDPTAYQAEHVPGALEFTADAPRVLIDRLRDAGHRQCALLGGAQLHRLFLREELVDELWLSVEPQLFGSGTALIGETTDVSLNLDEIARLPESDTLLLKYRINRR